MKKLTSVMAVILCLACVFALASCGGSDVDPVGSYKFVSASTQGENFKVGDVYEGFEITDDLYTLEIKSDKTFKMEVNGESTEGEWEVDGSVVKMTVDGDTVDAVLDGNVITLADDEEKLVFEKK